MKKRVVRKFFTQLSKGRFNFRLFYKLMPKGASKHLDELIYEDAKSARMIPDTETKHRRM